MPVAVFITFQVHICMHGVCKSRIWWLTIWGAYIHTAYMYLCRVEVEKNSLLCALRPHHKERIGSITAQLKGGTNRHHNNNFWFHFFSLYEMYVYVDGMNSEYMSLYYVSLLRCDVWLAGIFVVQSTIVWEKNNFFFMLHTCCMYSVRRGRRWWWWRKVAEGKVRVYVLCSCCW